MSFETPNQPERNSVSAAAPRRSFRPRENSTTVLTLMRKIFTLVAAIATIASTARGQTSTTSAQGSAAAVGQPSNGPPQICASDAERHRFDFWIGQDGQVAEYRSSEFDGKSLAFFIRDDAKPLSLHRLTFTPIDPQTVRQHSENSEDGGKSWKTEYDLYYHRKNP